MGLAEGETEEIQKALLESLVTATEEDWYGLIHPVESVIVRAYSDDTDDRLLEELRPTFIIMFEPCMEFVRRVEVHFLLYFRDVMRRLYCRSTNRRTLEWV
jgi:hypothetical protein